jgi:hypothetical protein
MSRSRKPGAHFAEKANKVAKQQRAIQSEVDDKPPSDKKSNSSAIQALERCRLRCMVLLIERLEQRQVGAFTIRIGGIDDDPPAPTYEAIFEE